GNFGAEQQITSDLDLVTSISMGDVDGDGDLDLLSSSYNDTKIAWYEHIDGLGSFGSQQIISSTTTNARQVSTADIDNDGDLDILAALYISNGVVWYENLDGAGNFGVAQVIASDQSAT